MAKISYYIEDSLVAEERLTGQKAESKVKRLCESLRLPAYYVYRDKLEPEGYNDIVLFASESGYTVRYHKDILFKEYDEAVDCFFDLLVIGYPLFLECGTEEFKIIIDYDEWP